ncbi:MAG: hypothetical protein WB588_01000 [Dehalococcoidia bacterium]
MMKFFPCYKCGVKNRMGDETCRNCGAPFEYHCPDCGSTIEAGDPECKNCSHTLNWPFQEGAQQDRDGKEPEGRESKKKPSLLAPFLGIVLVIIVVVGGIFLMTQLQGKPAPPILPVDNSSQPTAPGQINVNDTSPLLISNVSVDNTSYNSVEVTWDTSKPSTSQVLYNPKGEYPSTTPEKEALVTQHTIDLTSLKTKTIYYFKVKSVDQNRNEAISEQKAFGVGISVGRTQVVVVNSSLSVVQQPPNGTKTYIRGEIKNSGDLSVLVKDIQVPVMTSVAGNPQSEILAALDTTKTEIEPGDIIKFSATVSNDTDPDFNVSIRIND